MFCKKTFLFLSFFYFLAKFEHFIFLFLNMYLSINDENVVLLFPVHYLVVFMDKFMSQYSIYDILISDLTVNQRSDCMM